jgi:hypothetical protein
MKEENLKQIEFGKLSIGAKFYLNKPSAGMEDKSVHTKLISKKSETGAWTNAKNNFGLTTFVQYDKRVWTKN